MPIAPIIDRTQVTSKIDIIVSLPFSARQHTGYRLNLFLMSPLIDGYGLRGFPRHRFRRRVLRLFQAQPAEQGGSQPVGSSVALHLGEYRAESLSSPNSRPPALNGPRPVPSPLLRSTPQSHTTPLTSLPTLIPLAHSEVPQHIRRNPSDGSPSPV